MPKPKIPRKNKRFQPVYAAYMAHKLKKGVSKIEIAKALERKGGNFATIRQYLTNLFPRTELKRLMTQENKTLNEAIDILLWRYRESVMSKVERSAIGKKSWEGKTPEERSAIAIRREAAKTPEERSAIAIRREAAKTPEERSAIAIRREAAKTPEERSAIMRKIWGSRTPEERSAIVRKAWESRTPEERSAIARKSRETRRKLWDARISKVSYIENLPVLNLIPEKERISFLQKYMERFWETRATNEDAKLDLFSLRSFSKRTDFEDIKIEYQIAILEALSKWDGKTNLDTLVSDALIYRLIQYFSMQKRYYGLLSRMDLDTAEIVKERIKRGIVSKKKNRW